MRSHSICGGTSQKKIDKRQPQLVASTGNHPKSVGRRPFDLSERGGLHLGVRFLGAFLGSSCSDVDLSQPIFRRGGGTHLATTRGRCGSRAFGILMAYCVEIDWWSLVFCGKTISYDIPWVGAARVAATAAVAITPFLRPAGMHLFCHNG